MELQPLSREHIDGIMEIENDSFSIPWSRGSMEKELENKQYILWLWKMIRSLDMQVCGML